MLVWVPTVRVRVGGVAAVLLAVASFATLVAAPSAPTLNAPLVAGPRVTLSWSAVPGALGYRLSVALTPGGPDQYAYTVGPVTTVTFNSPYVGTGYVRAQAIDATGMSVPSNEVLLIVTSLTPVPAAPINLQAYLNGRSVNLVWAAGSGGGPPTAVVLDVGSTPGAADLGVFPLPLSTSVSVPDVPPGNYFVRAYAANGSGRSDPSNEVLVAMPSGGGCSPIPASNLTSTVSGGTVSFNWAAVPAAGGYRLEVASGPAGPILLSQIYGASTTSISFQGAPAGTYYARVVALVSCGAEAASGIVSFTVTGGGGGEGPRTPNPPPGQRLPLPNMSAVVNAVASAYRADLLNSCVEHGGNNVWLYRLVRELRRHDTRWGLNWKRGRVGDMSQDVVDYNFSADPDEGTTNVYIIDVIGGHCGTNPGPAWVDNTEATRQGGTIGRWTLQPYLAAGGGQ